MRSVVLQQRIKVVVLRRHFGLQQRLAPFFVQIFYPAGLARAVAQRPTDGYIVDSLGWVLYRKGRFEDAVRQLERAIELQPNDPVINDHLGDAYWQVGRRLEARFQWQRVLTLKPEDRSLIEDVEKKLEKGLTASGKRDG